VARPSPARRPINLAPIVDRLAAHALDDADRDTLEMVADDIRRDDLPLDAIDAVIATGVADARGVWIRSDITRRVGPRARRIRDALEAAFQKAETFHAAHTPGVAAIPLPDGRVVPMGEWYAHVRAMAAEHDFALYHWPDAESAKPRPRGGNPYERVHAATVAALVRHGLSPATAGDLLTAIHFPTKRPPASWTP